jgi:hypothetical protein
MSSIVSWPERPHRVGKQKISRQDAKKEEISRQDAKTQRIEEQKIAEITKVQFYLLFAICLALRLSEAKQTSPRLLTSLAYSLDCQRNHVLLLMT